MSVKSYTDVIIADNCFSIVNSNQKSKGALSILSSIEEVMRKGLQYRKSVEDEFSQLPKHELYAALRQQAEGIKNRYFEKTNTLSSFNKFFGGVSKKEKVIQATFDRIVLLAEPPPVFKLPNVLIQHIFGYLQVNNLGRVAQVNKHAENHVKQTEIQRAQEYGYKGKDFAEAKDYLYNLFHSISTLVKDGHIPEKYVVRKGRWPFWRYVDCEATLRNIKSLTANEAEVLKAHFSEILLITVQDGQLETVRALLKNGANPNVSNNQGETPLILAKLNKKMIQLLLDYGADPNIADNHGFSPLMWNNSNSEITTLLCERGAHVNHQANHNGYCALHFAAKNNQVETVKALLKNGADPNIINNQGKTPLILAKLNKKMIQLLLDYGADPNIADNHGFSPLIWNNSNSEITTLLCERGAHVNHQANYNGYCALHFAAKNNQVETVKALLKNGADPNIIDNQGKTPYELTGWDQFRVRSLLQ